MEVKVTNIYWSLGRFDGFIIFDAPNDETAIAAILQLASAGNVTPATARAFEANEIEKILGSCRRSELAYRRATRLGCRLVGFQLHLREQVAAGFKKLMTRGVQSRRQGLGGPLHELKSKPRVLGAQR